MDERNNGATYDAFDGVELELLSGKRVRCRALSVAEAVHFLRLFDRSIDDPSAHVEFLAEFPARMGITGERLADLGLEVEGLVLPAGLTFRDGTRLANIYGLASYAFDERRRSRAQLALLRAFPRKFGLDPHELTAPDIFKLAGSFTEEFYRYIYGLAEDFCYRLISGPAIKTVSIGRGVDGLSSMSVSTI